MSESACAGVQCDAVGARSVRSRADRRRDPERHGRADRLLASGEVHFSAKIDRTEPLNDRYIVFHLSGNQLWLAQLKMKCPGMTALSQLSFEKDENRLCEWDSVRTVNEDGIGGLRLGPKCNLPKFEPVSPEQVDMLKQHIRNPGPSSAEPKP